MFNNQPPRSFQGRKEILKKLEENISQLYNFLLVEKIWKHKNLPQNKSRKTTKETNKFLAVVRTKKILLRTLVLKYLSSI